MSVVGMSVCAGCGQPIEFIIGPGFNWWNGEKTGSFCPNAYCEDVGYHVPVTELGLDKVVAGIQQIARETA